MRRREFITFLGGAAAALPLAAHTQHPERMRRIGVIMSLAADDRQGQARLAAFVQRLQKLGWTDGRNTRIDIRWAAGDTNLARKYITQLILLAPDVILASGGSVATVAVQSTRAIPIVFTQTPDPVGGGLVASLARPGGNATGFTGFDYGMGAKWLELLRQAAPHVTRAAVLRDPTIPQGIGMFGAIQSVAPSFGVQLSLVNMRNAGGIDRDITAFAGRSNGSLIVTGSGIAIAQRKLIIALAARYKLPAIYFLRVFVTDGGLMSYGPDPIDPHRRAAAYVDRILKGEKPADLPVQAPTKYELAINLKTAKALGLTIPQSLLTRADEFIE
jgi:putative ABC transport system substrate-binding protein